MCARIHEIHAAVSVLSCILYCARCCRAEGVARVGPRGETWAGGMSRAGARTIVGCACRSPWRIVGRQCQQERRAKERSMPITSLGLWPPLGCSASQADDSPTVTVAATVCVARVTVETCAQKTFDSRERAQPSKHVRCGRIANSKHHRDRGPIRHRHCGMGRYQHWRMLLPFLPMLQYLLHLDAEARLRRKLQGPTLAEEPRLCRMGGRTAARLCVQQGHV